MKAIEGPADTFGQMPEDTRKMYTRHRDEIVYTVMSYITPILWVLKDGSVINPGHGYSNTTRTQKQNPSYKKTNAQFEIVVESPKMEGNTMATLTDIRDKWISTMESGNWDQSAPCVLDQDGKVMNIILAELLFPLAQQKTFVGPNKRNGKKIRYERTLFA